MANNKYEINTNSIQKKIFQFVDESPGIRYRELLRITGLTNGVLSYHLNLLHNSGKIRINRVNDRVTRYYSQDVPGDEFNLIGLFRQLTTRRIVMYILESETCGFNDIVELQSPFNDFMAFVKIKRCKYYKDT